MGRGTWKNSELSPLYRSWDMKKYEEIWMKYEGKMKKYVEIMEKYEEICGIELTRQST